jgi:hypothetical protein
MVKWALFSARFFVFKRLKADSPQRLRGTEVFWVKN